MTRVHVCASAESLRGVLDWLAAECRMAPGDLASTIHYQESGAAPSARLEGVPEIAMHEVTARVAGDDAVIVAGAAFQRVVGDLLAMGIRNVYNGNEMIRRGSAAQRFVEAASSMYIGPTAPISDVTVTHAAGRFALDPLVAAHVPRHKLFIVNSMPKSGTVWMIAMLEDLLGVRAQQQITVSHVADIEDDWNKANNHGAVTLVRDLRDVAVSWFHDAQRADRALGFATPRYPDLTSFYYEFFVGTLFGTKRFYFGDLERWLNLVCAHYVPLVRYEDMIVDAAAALRKVMTFWRVDVSPEVIQRIVRDYSFASMPAKVGGQRGFVAEIVGQGHLRRGRSGSWRDEMPDEIARDINRRFADYQRRLGYVQP